MSSYSAAAFWTSFSHIVTVFSMLLRNIIFARFLNSTDFAIALTFGLVLSLFEHISNLGHENLMQRSKHGNQKEFQATMQCMMIARGFFVAIFIVLIAPSIPFLLSLNNKIHFDYALLAIIPLINGFSHLDHQRLHRKKIYSLTAKISLYADALSIFLALVCVLIWDNYWAFYISFVFRHSISTILSHIYSKRAYEIAFNKNYALELLKFGAPLLVVGLLKYIGTEFDKAVIANIAGLNTFATYMLTLMVMVNGANIVSVALSKIFIRRLSVEKNCFAKAVQTNGIVQCYLVFPIILVLCVFGENLINLIFGSQYSTIPYLILIAAGIVGMRSLNHWLNQAVISSAPTQLLLKADLGRFTIALTGVYLFYDSANVIIIALIFWCAEISYFIVLALLLNKRFPLIKTGALIFILYLCFISLLSWGYHNNYESSWELRLLFTIPTLAIFYSLFLIFSSTCRRQTFGLYKLTLNLIRLR